MNKSELIAEIAEKNSLSKVKAKELLDSVLDTIKENSATGEVVLAGFGKFHTKIRKARTGIKPGTTEKIDIPEKSVFSFKAYK